MTALEQITQLAKNNEQKKAEAIRNGSNIVQVDSICGMRTLYYYWGSWHDRPESKTRAKI